MAFKDNGADIASSTAKIALHDSQSVKKNSQCNKEWGSFGLTANDCYILLNIINVLLLMFY